MQSVSDNSLANIRSEFSTPNQERSSY